MAYFNLLRLIGACALICLALSANAQEVTLLTEEDPPFSMSGVDGKPTGFAVEVVEEIQKRIGEKTHPIMLRPWARVYRAAKQMSHVAAFAMSRTKEREDLFQWVGPIVENDWVIVARKSDKLRLNSLDDAKRLNLIGSVRDYAWTDYLLAKGFTNLDLVPQRKLNPIKLNAKRIDAFVSADISYPWGIRAAGLNPQDFEIVLRFQTVQMYIAFSKNTDTDRVRAWQNALAQMKADGTFAAIYKKWLPNDMRRLKAVL